MISFLNEITENKEIFKIHFEFEWTSHFQPDRKCGPAVVVHCKQHRRSGRVEKHIGLQILML